MQISSPKELSDLQTIDLQKFTPPGGVGLVGV